MALDCAMMAPLVPHRVPSALHRRAVACWPASPMSWCRDARRGVRPCRSSLLPAPPPAARAAAMRRSPRRPRAQWQARACALCGDAALAAQADGIGDRGQNSKTAAVYEAEPSLRKRRKEGAASSRRLSVAIWVAAGCLTGRRLCLGRAPTLLVAYATPGSVCLDHRTDPVRPHARAYQ